MIVFETMALVSLTENSYRNTSENVYISWKLKKKKIYDNKFIATRKDINILQLNQRIQLII